MTPSSRKYSYEQKPSVSPNPFELRSAQTTRRTAVVHGPPWKCLVIDQTESACLAATDAHNLQNRPPLLSEARDVLRQRYGEAVAQSMVQDKPAYILGLVA